MNHLYAAQLDDGSGKWRYIMRGRDGAFAVGYCAHDPQNNGELCPGHDTKDGAYEHMRQYGLDNVHVREDNPKANTQNRCKAPGCATFTSGSVTIGGYTYWPLCSEHRTREVVDGLYEMGESWES